MKNNLLALVIVFTISCGYNEPLFEVKMCGEVCAVNAQGNVVFGNDARQLTCNTGILRCEENLQYCEGFVPYGPEVCDLDNIDEDCDGESNNIEYTALDYRNTCNRVGACSSAKLSCFPDGNWQCIPLSQAYGEEICDGVDNDCDGLTDEDDPDLPNGDFVYTGAFETANVGICRAGLERCINGKIEIVGEVLPQSEICGNNIDDDCDGLTDERTEDNGDPVAIMLIIDFSGSMLQYIESVVTALCNLSEDELLARSLFSVVAVAAENTRQPHIEVVSYFNNVSSTCEVLNEYLNDSNLTGGLEYIPYAIWSLNNSNNEESIVWPEGFEKEIIFFTDELPQGYFYELNYDVSQAIASCNENNYTVSGFNNSHAEWQAITEPCQGWQEYLYLNPRRMTELIQEKFIGFCRD